MSAMNEMVERVAKALAAQDALGATADGPGTQRQSWKAYEPMARAAIEAMREPTPTMSEAGCPTEDNSGAPYCYDRSVTDSAWRAMIDAALK